MRKLIVIYALFNLLSSASAANMVDSLVERKLRMTSIQPSEICSDDVFLRRAYITLTGRLPEVIITTEFISSNDFQKRQKLIDNLLSSESFVEYQVLKWGDLLRIKSEFPSNIWPNAVQAYNRWLTEQIRANVSYDQFVRDLLVCSGSNFRSPQVSFYRAFQDRKPENIAANVALLFLGQHTAHSEVAQFFTQIRYKSTGEWKEEIVYIDTDKVITPGKAKVNDLEELSLPQGSDFREIYARWLTSPTNRDFARAMVNRVWFWLMGRGIVHEPDDMRADNPPSNSELLEYLSDKFINSGYNVRELFRTILLSDTFGRSSLSNASNRNDDRNFSHYPTIRLNAEVLVDAVADITGINDRYVSRVPEPYSYFPSDIRAVQLGDATVSSPQLELFGRPSRDVSMENNRSNEINNMQTLYLLNSTSILDRIDQSRKIASIVTEAKTREDIITKIYLMTLSRYPSNEELSVLTQYAATMNNDRMFANNLVWAQLNNPEFLFNH